MGKDNRNLLSVLKAELEFLEKGGYRDAGRVSWRPKFIFQDSPTCLAFEPAQQPVSCVDCIIIQLMPENLRIEKIPCRFIPLNERGDTLDSLYRTSTQEEIESVVGQWLKTRIARLERDTAENARASKHARVQTKAKRAADR